MAGVYITGTAEYAQARARLGVDLDTKNLSDDVIALDTFSGKAEDDVVSRLTSPDTLTAAQQTKVKRACILRLAAELVDAVPIHQSEGVEDTQVRYERAKRQELKMSLYQASDEEIEDIIAAQSTDSTQASDFNIFGTADGARGTWGSNPDYRSGSRNR